MTSEQRAKIIQALLEKDMDRIRQAKGEVILISNFYEMLMFCNSDRPEEDYKKIRIAEGPYLELLKRLNTDKEGGDLTGKPFWMIPASGLSDEEIQAYKEQHKPT
jgi:hypothetical protein